MILPFDVTNLVPTQILRTVIGIDLLLISIDWYEGEEGDVQREKKIVASQGNSPWEIALSVCIKCCPHPKFEKCNRY